MNNDSSDAGDNDREQHGRSGRAASNAAASAANASPKPAPRRLPRPLTAALLLAILAAGALSAWWMAARADREMRADLLQQARLVAQAVNTEHAKALTGTEADLDNSAYQQLKKQFAAVRSANLLCRFVYLMGRKADGTVFFFVDSEPAGSKDYSPPGQVYDEVTASLLHAFDAKVAVVDGPAADRWGTWVSALVPINNTQTGAVIAVLGMDIDARAWKWDVAARVALPVGLMLVLLIGMAVAFVSARRVDASPKPVLWRLLPSLAVIVILLMVGAGVLLWQQYQRSLAGVIAAETSDVSGDLRMALNQEASGLTMAAQPIATDTTVQKALREGDADRLLAAWRPVFETMHRENHLTHFYFFDKNRICLLRVHKPEKRGDRIERFTALEAQRTGKTASGIDLGPLGTFTLRVVQPVFEGGALVGYVELGKEIEEVLDVLHTQSGIQLAVVIHKEHLKRQGWEDGMRLLGREADWDRLPNSTVAYASQGRLPDVFASWADQLAGEHAHGETDWKIALDGKDWGVSLIPMQEASGKEVGDLLVMRDITADNAAFACLLALGGTAGTVLLALLLGWIYVLLHRTDRSIRAQQTKLWESRDRFNQLAEQSGTFTWEVDAQGLYTYVSHVAEAVLGYRPDELVGRMHFYDLHPEEGRAAFKTAAFAVFTRTEPFLNLGNAAQAKNGRHVWISTNGIPLLNADGILRGYRGSDTDITERKRAEDELQKLASVIRYSIELVNLATLDGKMIFLNEAGSRMLGISPAEVEQFNIMQVIPAHLKEKVETELLPAIMAGTWAGELQYLNLKTGQLTDVHAMTFTIRDQATGAPLYLANVSLDITEQKRAEDELRKSEMRHRLLFESSRDAIMTLEPPLWKFTSGNPATLTMFRAKNEEEFVSQGPWNLSPQRQPDGRASADKAKEMIETAMRDGSHFFEWTHRRLDGADFPATVLLTKIEIAGQAFLQATVRDITAQKRAEEALLETNRQLEQAVSHANEMAEQATTASVTKSEFLANMSHEIRTPLTAILGYSELLMDEGTSHQERKEHSRVILRNGKHLLELVNDILDISKIEADKLVLERRPCSVHAIVAGVVSMMRVRAIKKHLALTARYVTPMPQTIMMDEARLRQALLNLVGNAIKFTEAGEVSISVSLVQGQQDTPPIIRIDVSDTGIGISAETLGHLFHPFTQADSSTTRKYGGTGLGLTITKRIIEKMGGEIRVQSAPGKGSTFTLMVPTGSLEGIDMVEQTAEAMAATTETPHQPERTHLLQGLRILLAEDGPDNQLLIRTVLSKAGAEVEVADNGLLAVHAATARTFDLVLMDMQMPEMDGYEATGQLRAKGYEVPIIALTAHALAGDRTRCIDAGCTDYLTKPIDRAAMIDLILKHTSRQQPVPEMPVDAIASRFADDPDMAEVIESFVQQLPQRCQAMREALNNNDLPTLQRLAHQMKGAGGSYGYPMLTRAGKELGAAAKAGDQEACGLELRNLAVMCQAIGRGLKTKDLSQGHPS